MSDARHAIEALRAGVPNRAAIRLMGTWETAIEQRFRETLGRCPDDLRNGTQPAGQVVAGGFGTGKSHLLGCLKELALDADFIVSCVVISKETPLSDPGRLYVSAMRLATVPHCNDDVMTAVLDRLQPGGEAFETLDRWTASDEAALSPLFAALLYLLPRPATTPDRVRDIARFLAGGPLSVPKVKQWLKETGAAKLFPLKTLKQPDLIQQRLRFAPRLFAAAGYGGWVVLLDEVELIGRYGIVQRARSYAELARWLGLDDGERLPGVVTVAAITDDFTEAVISKRRDDEQAPLRLVNRNERPAAERARRAITFLNRDRTLLRVPDQDRLQACLAKVHRLYEDAYSWQAGTIDIGPLSATKSMRQHIKSWITTWDLARLYGAPPPPIETMNVATNYAETREIEAQAQPADADFDDD